MNKKSATPIFVLIFIYAIIFIWLAISLFRPVLLVKDFYSNNFFINVISKSSSTLECIYYNIEDEDRISLFPLLLKYTTGIDLENPTSYFESQIPLIAYMNLPSLIASQDSPIVVIPNNETTSDKETNSNVDNLPKENESITVINPNDKDVPKKKLDKSKPLVLIFHTHTTESYNPRNEKDRNFTTDYSQNVVKVGEEIKKELEEKYGIAVIHDITIHDLPTREKGYEKSRPTVESYIKKYPSLKLIIDLHRDASDSVSKTTAIINNERYARPMFVVGAKNKNYKSNAEKVIKINDILNSMYPNFSRGILYKNARYNQDLSSKMILLEIGCNLNSLEEAIRTGKIMAKVIAIYLK